MARTRKGCLIHRSPKAQIRRELSAPVDTVVENVGHIIRCMARHRSGKTLSKAQRYLGRETQIHGGETLSKFTGALATPLNRAAACDTHPHAGRPDANIPREPLLCRRQRRWK